MLHQKLAHGLFIRDSPAAFFHLLSLLQCKVVEGCWTFEDDMVANGENLSYSSHGQEIIG